MNILKALRGDVEKLKRTSLMNDREIPGFIKALDKVLLIIKKHERSL